MSFQPYYCYNKRANFEKSQKKTIFARLFLILGIFLVSWVAYPLINFQLVESNKLAQNQFLIPGKIEKPITYTTSPNQSKTDYTQANSWFPDAKQKLKPKPSNPQITKYTLSIPKLGIQKATVNLIGEDLSKNLIHYKGTAIPGTLGNGVIFGHSILPQFYNPKNYMAIFSTLHTLKNGDQIIIDYDNITYQYQVVDMFEVTPKEISVLNQTYDDKYITLITCTPPGTYLRRLIVKAKLIPYQGSNY